MNNNVNKLAKYFDELFSRLESLNGKIIGSSGQSDKTRLAKDDRQAYINKAADEFILKKGVKESPPQYDIRSEDIIKEIVKREIEDTIG